MARRELGGVLLLGERINIQRKQTRSERLGWFKTWRQQRENNQSALRERYASHSLTLSQQLPASVPQPLVLVFALEMMVSIDKWINNKSHPMIIAPIQIQRLSTISC